MRLTVDDHWTYFHDAEGVYGLVDSVTSYMAKGRFFARSYKSGAWDGRKRLREFDRSKKLYRIPTGLLSRVLEVLDAAGHSYQLQDDRVLDVPDAVFTLADGTELRPYQCQAVELALAKGRGVIKMGTGGGKTSCAAALLASHASLGDRHAIWITDRTQLLYQTHRALERLLGHKVGICGDGQQVLEDTTVMMVPTLLSRIDALREHLAKARVLILDEAHHAQADTWFEAVQAIPAPYRYGVTATPAGGGDGLHLLGVTGELIVDIPTRMLIDLGFLMEPEIRFAKYDGKVLDKKLDTRAARKYGVLENPERTAKVVDLAWELRTSKLPSMTLVKEISHGERIRSAIGKTGIKVEYLQGATPQEDRDTFLAKLVQGDLDHLVASTQIMAEGVDIPALAGLINATGTRGGGSKASAADDEVGRVTIQSIGRLIRKAPGKVVARYYDLYDVGHKALKEATKQRVSALEEERFQNVEFI